ncbi:MAG: hypothetical protein STHCBS139747_005251 [Sporothrix thermara]
MADRRASTLPAPRNVLAGLIGAIAAAPITETPAASTALARCRGVSSRQTRIIEDKRPFLAVLHVLYPTLVLPALDLLDRRRVVRWGERRLPSSSLSSSSSPPLYQIRGGADRPHVVHLRAWHCTCAFFALQAAATIPLSTKDEDEDEDEDEGEGHGDGDGDGNGNVNDQRLLKDALAHLPLAFSTPPCKHLLACLLAEEWTALDEHIVAGIDQGASGSDVDGCTPETLAGVVAGVL